MVRYSVAAYGTAWFGQAGKLRRREFSFVEAGSGWLGAVRYGKARFVRARQARYVSSVRGVAR